MTLNATEGYTNDTKCDRGTYKQHQMRQRDIQTRIHVTLNATQGYTNGMKMRHRDIQTVVNIQTALNATQGHTNANSHDTKCGRKIIYK